LLSKRLPGARSTPKPVSTSADNGCVANSSRFGFRAVTFTLNILMAERLSESYDQAQLCLRTAIVQSLLRLRGFFPGDRNAAFRLQMVGCVRRCSLKAAFLWLGPCHAMPLR